MTVNQAEASASRPQRYRTAVKPTDGSTKAVKLAGAPLWLASLYTTYNGCIEHKGETGYHLYLVSDEAFQDKAHPKMSTFW